MEDVNHTVLHLTSREVNDFLVAEFGTLTHKEMDEARESWKAMRWQRGECGIPEFISSFHSACEFLELHHNAPSEGEKVMTLMRAVSTTPTFAAMANAAFYIEAPTLALQTLDTLIAVYRRVFRGQYADATAGHHDMTANQAVHVQAGAESMASARTAEVGLNATQMAQMTAAITKAITQALNGGGRRGQHQKQPQQQRHDKADNGKCHEHPYGSHTWAQCNRNPDRK